jgi:hypothetical protein
MKWKDDIDRLIYLYHLFFWFRELYIYLMYLYFDWFINKNNSLR